MIGNNFAIDVQFTDIPRNQLRVLGAEIKNKYFFCHKLLGLCGWSAKIHRDGNGFNIFNEAMDLLKFLHIFAQRF